MEAEFHIVHVAYPTWFRFAVLGTLAFAPLGLWLARRSYYPALLCLIPISGNLFSGFVGLTRVLEGMSLSGGGRRAAAAGCAEALFPLELGAAVGLALSGILIFRLPYSAHAASSQMRVLAIATFPLVVLVAAQVSFAMWLVVPGRAFASAPLLLSRSGMCAALLLVVVIAVFALRHTARPGPLQPHRSAFAVTSAIAMLDLGVVHFFRHSLQAIALGR